MSDLDVICLSSDSSRPPSPYINVSEVFNDTDKLEVPKTNHSSYLVNNSPKTTSKCETNFLSSIGSPLKNRLVHNLSDSDSESSPIFNDNYTKLHNEYQDLIHDGHAEGIGLASSLEYLDNKNIKRKGATNIKMTKDERLEQKLRKQQEKEKLKAEKEATKLLQQLMKPGNCIKHVTAIIDSSLVNCPFGGSLVASIQNGDSKNKITTQPVPYSITWTRDQPNSEVKEESDVVIIWQWEIVIPAVKNHTLCLKILEVQHQFPGKSISLVIYGINSYFSYLRSKKKQAKTPSNEYPYVSRKEIEEELIELQIMASCNHRLIESPEELGQLVAQITKSIAETPFKLEKQKREFESLEWFAAGDSRDCVAVDKAGNGLLRLWQQQLCQFNLASHDTAQAIVAAYPSPSALLKAYDACSGHREAEDLLKNIAIRRGQGPLSSSRRIGPELSKKIYTFFCSTDGEAPLSQGQ